MTINADICNFILNYMEIYAPSENLKDNLFDIIENNGKVNDDLNVKDEVIAYSMKYVMNLYDEEKKIVRG